MDTPNVEALMFRRRLSIFLVVLLAACTGTVTPAPTPSAGQMDLEEQAVYAALLQNFYGSANLVIMDTTATSPGGVGDTAATLKKMLQDMRGLEQKTADSFRARNATESPFRADMNLGSPYTVLSQAQMNLFFSQNQDGWQAFYAQYPSAAGITTLSRVGFNNSLSQALVYVGTMSHYLAGAGYFVLLKKVNGTWMVDQKVMTWIS